VLREIVHAGLLDKKSSVAPAVADSISAVYVALETDADAISGLLLGVAGRLEDGAEIF
jgi:hypothetical protein